MKEETYYRMMHDAKLPCHHCGTEINLFEIIAEGYVLRDGKNRKTCPHCGKVLSPLEYRDYGVPQKFLSVTSGFGVAGSAKHFSIHTLKGY